MILHHKNLKIDVKRLKFKKGFKYSDDLSFVTISYDKKELLLQSPNMYIPFEVKKYTDESKKKYLDLTFQTSSDKDTNDFLVNLNKIFNKVKNIYKKNEVNYFIKETNIYKWMRFKLDDECLFFNQNKEKLKDIPSKSFGVFIFSLNGLWIMNNKVWFNWTILQSKLYIPKKLKEYYFFDEEDKNNSEIKNNIPPQPPPPPPPPPPFFKKNTSIKDQINKNKKSIKKNVKKTDSFTPTVDEIMLALKKLNSI